MDCHQIRFWNVLENDRRQQVLCYLALGSDGQMEFFLELDQRYWEPRDVHELR